MRLQWSPAGRQHCSHAYLGEALVTKIEQQSPATDKALDSGARLSTREPAAGGTHQPVGPSNRCKSRRAKTQTAGPHAQPDYHCTPGG